MGKIVTPLCLPLLLIFVSQIFCGPAGKSLPNYPVEEKDLAVPSLEKVARALRKGLKINFELVDVDVVDCPDLTKEPFSLKGKGLSGSPKIIEVGGEAFLLPTPKKEKIYDLIDIYHKTGLENAFFLGAGAGPFEYVKISSEYIANSVISNGQVQSGSQVAKVVDGNYKAEILPNHVSEFSFMGNFFVSKGESGKVLRVKCTKRIGNDDFPTALRERLRQEFPEQFLGMGGTFLATGSKIKQHVQPDFSTTPIYTAEERDAWLKWYDMDPPLVAVGVVVTGDPGLDLRDFHFHSISNHGEAGHFHYDMQPDTVEYLGYFNMAEQFLRIDRPTKNSNNQ